MNAYHSEQCQNFDSINISLNHIEDSNDLKIMHPIDGKFFEYFEKVQ